VKCPALDPINTAEHFAPLGEKSYNILRNTVVYAFSVRGHSLVDIMIFSLTFFYDLSCPYWHLNSP
jgi:hypothetical protein